MFKKFVFTTLLVLSGLVFGTNQALAQVKYEDVVEKIHYGDPQPRGGQDNHLLEAVKETGAENQS